MRDALVSILLVAGTGLALLACAGVLLMRAAVLVRDSFSLIGTRAILVAGLALVTSPVLTHATARAIHKRERR